MPFLCYTDVKLFIFGGVDMDIVFSSERLNFRKISANDYKSLCKILQDKEIMYAWEHAFSDEEVSEWIDKNLVRYKNEGFSYFAAIEKNTQSFIGVIGPLIDDINGKKQIEIAYILDKEYWGSGYAIEGAKACVEYAFNALNIDKVIAQIRPENTSSRKVAEKIGMKIEGEFIKTYNGKDMLHLIYSRSK